MGHKVNFVGILILCQGLWCLYVAGLDINVRCDDQGIVYVDGVPQGNTTTHDDVLTVGDLPETTSSIAVYYFNDAMNGGLLASASNGLVSDGSWRCSDHYEEGWYAEEFNDDHWGAAYVISANDGSVFTRENKIYDDAKWISNSRNYGQESHGVYCRGSLGPISAIVRCDDYGKIMVDGRSVGRTDGHTEVWRGTFTSVPHVIALECQNVGGNGGLMTSTSTGVVTDTTWKCSDSFQSGWHTVTYDDSSWDGAYVTATNRPGWGHDGRFPDSANFIWSSAEQVSQQITVYCRVVLGLQLFAKTSTGTTAQLYVDDELLEAEDVTSERPWVNAIPKTTQLLALHATNTQGGDAAAVLSLSNDGGMGSNVLWRCTGAYYEGWEMRGFNDSTWPEPVLAGNETDGGLAGAQWMKLAAENTTPVNGTEQQQHLYCRGHLECDCHQLCQAVIVGHTHTCACYTGYSLPENGTLCQDIDECSLNKTEDYPGCEMGCENTAGSYACTCPQGYEIHPGDRHKCRDVDECEEKTHNCTELGQQCQNTGGGFTCVDTSQSTTLATAGSKTTKRTDVTATSTANPTTTKPPTTTDISNSTSPHSLSQSSSHTYTTAIVVPIIIAVILIAVVIIAVCVVKRKRWRSGGQGVSYTVDNPLVDSWSKHAQDEGIRYQDLQDHS